VQGFLIALGVGVFMLLVANPIVQRFMPTHVDDGFGRKIGYRIIVRLVTAAALLALILIVTLATGGHL